MTATLCSFAVAQEQSSLNNPSLTANSTNRPRPRPLAASLRLDVNRVLIPVMVTDAEDRKVEGLHKQDFRILEDGIPQDISEFFVDETPVSVGIVLDSSNSMRNKIDHAREAISAFLNASLAADESFLIAVQDRPQLLHAFTSDYKSLAHEMNAIQPRGWTALYDGMYLGIDRLKRAARGSRVLLVLSDGGDNNSRYTESEMKALVRESDVRIFTISIMERSPALEKLAELSGGRAFRVRKLEDLEDQAVALSALVHGEYVLGFRPGAQNRDGKYHNIKVELTQKPEGKRMQTSWRHGYYAPLE